MAKISKKLLLIIFTVACSLKAAYTGTPKQIDTWQPSRVTSKLNFNNIHTQNRHNVQTVFTQALQLRAVEAFLAIRIHYSYKTRAHVQLCIHTKPRGDYIHGVVIKYSI